MRTESSMMRAIMGAALAPQCWCGGAAGGARARLQQVLVQELLDRVAEAALGVEQELPAGDHLLAGREAGEDLHLAVARRPVPW